MNPPAPASNDEPIYNLVDLSPPPAPDPTPARQPAPPTEPPAPAPPAVDEVARAAPGGGLLGRLMGRLRRDGEAGAAVPAADSTGPAADARADGAVGKGARGPSLRPRKRRRGRDLRTTIPAWLVSVLVHAAVLGALGVASLSPDVRSAVARSFDLAPIDTALSAKQSEELTTVLAPIVAAPRDQAITAMQAATPGAFTGLGTGSGPPTATPRVAVSADVGERAGLASIVDVVNPLPPQSLIPSRPSYEPGGGGGGLVAGEVGRPTKGIGEALDQLAREILRHLQKHKLTVVWLFDESGSMKDDQRAVREKFDIVTDELDLRLDGDQKSANALTHAIIGFGQATHYELKPTTDIRAIGRAIDRLAVDETGLENTCRAVINVVERFAGLIGKNRRLLIVLITDESGDDGSDIEEARQLAVSHNVPIYVIGRQAMFGKETLSLPYKDPLTNDMYWPQIRRGPESPRIETLRWDGLHHRWDEQPSGFAPYELARLTKETGGIYFLLPSEEFLRSTQREKLYSMDTLKEYVPDYEARVEYDLKVSKSPLRGALFQIIEETNGYTHRHRYPIEPGPLTQAMLEEGPKVRDRLAKLLIIERRLRGIEKYRNIEKDKRWQAHYDLTLATVVMGQVKAYEYLACLDEMVSLLKRNKLVPSKLPVPDKLIVEWEINHSTDKKAPPQETEKKYAEARRLFDIVLNRHPNTPWSDLAQDMINRGFGCQRTEWHHTPQYDERAKLVPKY